MCFLAAPDVAVVLVLISFTLVAIRRLGSQRGQNPSVKNVEEEVPNKRYEIDGCCSARIRLAVAAHAAAVDISALAGKVGEEKGFRQC